MSLPNSLPPADSAPDQPTPAERAALHAWFAAEVQSHETALRRWLRVRFPKADHDDLVQESFLRILRARATAEILHPKTYLFTVARNLALNDIRHARHENRDALSVLDASTVLDDKPGIPEAVARQQENELLIQAIQSLPDRCREVFTLRRLYGVPVRDIAARLGISERTAEVHINVAIRRCTEFVRHADARAPRAQPASPSAAPFTPREVRHA